MGKFLNKSRGRFFVYALVVSLLLTTVAAGGIVNRYLAQLAQRAAGFYPRSVGNAAVFNDDDSDYLIKTYGGAGDQQKWILSAWIKHGNIGRYSSFMGCDIDGDSYTYVNVISDSNYFRFTNADNGAAIQLLSTRLLRDVTAWYHYVLAVDTTQATDTNRVRGWINNESITWTGTYPAQNATTAIMSTSAQNIFRAGGGNPFDGYAAETILLDGQTSADPPALFGETKNGVWVPKESLSLTYGTNGFHLDFAASGDLGNDVSGNNNDFTVNGSPAQVTDTPTSNYAVINSVRPSPGTLTYGNTVISGTENGVGTIFVSKGKWAWKVTSAENGNYGIIADDAAGTQYVAADVSGEVIEFELDLDGLTLKKRVDGGGLETVQDPIASGKMWSPHFEAAATVDFGASGFTPTDSTYFVINSANLALYEQNTILDSIDQPAEAVYVNTRTGTGASATVSDVLFDVSAGSLITIKNRDQADGWKVHSTVGTSGVDYYVAYDANTAETQNVNSVTARSSTGYTVGTGAAGWNDNTEKFLDWVLREGAAYGLDLVTYEGDGNASQLINHGLGVVPSMIWVKNVDAADSWAVLHSLAASDYETDYAALDVNNAFADLNTYWNDTAPSSTQFTVGTIDNVNALNETYLAVVMADIPGLCKAFAFLGNGNADGPYIPLGFRSAISFIKRVPDAPHQWFLHDKVDIGYNPTAPTLGLSETRARDSNALYNVDYLAQGIKIRSNNYASLNNNGTLYIGMAWAEQFGAYSNAR